MSASTLSFWRVAQIQFRLMLDQGWRGRIIGFGLILVQLVALVGFGRVLGVSIDTDGVRVAQAVDFGEAFGVPLTPASAAILVCLGAMLVIGWFGPFKLWDGEAPSRRGYHWAMPVAKGRHDLARVLAGIGLLMSWGVALYGTVVALSLVTGRLGELAALTPLVWACLFLGPLVLYLVTSFFTVRMEHPSGWIWSIVGGLAAVTTLSSLLLLGPLTRGLEHLLFERYGIVSAVGGPVARTLLEVESAAASTWPLTWLGWAALLSLAVVWAAHDRRRLP